jgi:integrase
VAALSEKPPRGQHEAHWLEVHEAALLLEAARQLRAIGGTRLDAEQIAQLRADWAAGGRSKRALARTYGVSDVVIGRILRGEQEASAPSDEAAFAYPLVATFLLSGGRRAEVLGLELDDVSFDRKTITFRPNRWRRLKNRRSHRVVPLWPQLEAILRPYLDQRVVEHGGRLLFPSFASGAEARLIEIRKLLDRVAERAGYRRGEFYTRALRDTYCAARLQTLDHGAPVTPYTVSRELGHGSLDMVERVYAHLGAMRRRSEVVEFRVEQHLERLGDQLRALGFVTQNVTREAAAAENEAPHASADDGGATTSPDGPGRIRTGGLLLRRQALYPTELRTRRLRGGEASTAARG